MIDGACDATARIHSRKRVLVLGGGFGGAYAARMLGRTLGARADVEVVLISQENYLLFTPMLHEVAAGDLHPPDIVAPLRRFLRNVRFIQGETVSIDLQSRRVNCTVGPLRRPQEVSYDYLLLALGSETNFFGMAGVAEYASSMKTLGDAALLQNRMVALLEDAATEPDEAARRRLVTFVVAGGGFAGVETAGAMNDFLRDAIRQYPELDPSMLRLVLVHSGEALLPELGDRLGRYAEEQLRRRGVEIVVGARVTGYDRWVVTLSRGESIPANTLVWTAGVKPAPTVEALPVEKMKGRLKVNMCLELAGHEGVVWAVGDSAAVPDGRGGFHPPTAQHAMRQGLAAAKNIAAALDRREPKPFRFSTIGLLASIGHRTGVAQILGVRFSGLAAWWLWRSVYLLKLPGLAKKVRVAIQWTLDLMFPRQVEQLLTLRALEQVERLASQVHSGQSEQPR
ncbi:MAG: NAD(P)/FAD-dependent oxidoreductase [Phycisphaeraceae bacterium]|nr:NAD(P)/FAD-dependent oxidoreductase [Phycisphaeraceae bacterium]